MKIEYEATFVNINKQEIKNKLKAIGAILIRPEFLQKRVVFDLPSGHEIKDAWVRLRDEGNKITLTFKVVSGDKIEGQKEIDFRVDDFEATIEFLETIGCQNRAYQENKRELWKIDNTEITIDQWPFLEPYIEIESNSESAVKSVAEKLGFDYQNALFCSTDTLYSKKYNISEDIINRIPKVTFEMENPFIK